MKCRTALALVLSGALALSGCSAGGNDISKRSIVSAVSVNLEEDGYLVTVEYLTRMGEEEQAYESREGRGETFAQAVSDLELSSGKTFYLDGCRVLLVDGVKTRGELEALLREVDAHGGIRPLTLVAVSPGTKRLLEKKPREGDSAGEEVFALLTSGEFPQRNLKDCLNLLSAPGRGLMLPVVERGEEQAAITGYLSPGNAALLLVPPEASALIPFAKPQKERQFVRTISGEGYSADWVLEKKRLKIVPQLEGQKLSFLLKADAEGYLLSVRGPKNEDLLMRAQEDICRQMLEEYSYILNKISRSSQNDLFNLGKILELAEPEFWQENGSEWQEKLPETELRLEGSVLLRDKKRILEER